jgi:hypothetical protein
MIRVRDGGRIAGAARTEVALQVKAHQLCWQRKRSLRNRRSMSPRATGIRIVAARASSHRKSNGRRAPTGYCRIRAITNGGDDPRDDNGPSRTGGHATSNAAQGAITFAREARKIAHIERERLSIGRLPRPYPLLRGQSRVVRTTAQTMPQPIQVTFG